MKCEFCGRPSRDSKAEVCNGCGANLPADEPNLFIDFGQETDEMVICSSTTSLVITRESWSVMKS